MSEVNAEIVRRVAHLARLDVAVEAMPKLADELNNILKWVEQLDAVDTSGVAPMTSVVAQAPRWRDDVVTDGDCSEQVLQNAPESHYGFYAVPKVIE